MFYDKFKSLCDEKGVSCTKAAVQMGLSNATPTKWKKTGATPDGGTLAKIAFYFGVTVDYLLGEENDAPKEKQPSLSKEEQRELDIAEYIEEQKRFLESQPALMFNGYPASKEAIDSLLHAMELGKRAVMSISEEEKKRAAEIKRRVLDFDDDCEDLLKK